MSKSIRRIIAAFFLISIFTIAEPSCFNFTTLKTFAEEKPYLRNIYFSEGDSIEFSEDTYSYVVDVDKDVEEAFIKAKPNDPSDTVKIDGKIVTKDNYYKGDVTLKNGKNTIKIEVDDDKTNSKLLYFVYVYRGGKDAVYLNDIKINDSTIGFQLNTKIYNIELDQEADLVNLDTFPIDEDHLITINGKELNETNSIKLKFNGIGKYTLTIEITDKDTERKGIYTINIYLGIPVSPDVSDSINAVLKPNQWIIVNGRWRYNDVFGKCLKNTWFYDDKYKKFFHFNSRGNMQTGWIEDGDNWYYLASDGEMQTGWILYKNEWYYLDLNGAMKTGWIEYNNKWYYLRKDGTMATGWILNNDMWYYLHSDGEMQTGWLYYGKKWYLIDSSGIMQTGWKNYNGDWYYFDSNGSMKSGEWLYSLNNWYYLNYYGNMRIGWLSKDDKFYYFNGDGTMRTSPITIDGYTYYFNEDGSVNFG